MWRPSSYRAISASLLKKSRREARAAAGKPARKTCAIDARACARHRAARRSAILRAAKRPPAYGGVASGKPSSSHGGGRSRAGSNARRRTDEGQQRQQRCPVVKINLATGSYAGSKESMAQQGGHQQRLTVSWLCIYSGAHSHHALPSDREAGPLTPRGLLAFRQGKHNFLPGEAPRAWRKSMAPLLFSYLLFCWRHQQMHRQPGRERGAARLARKCAETNRQSLRNDFSITQCFAHGVIGATVA